MKKLLATLAIALCALAASAKVPAPVSRAVGRLKAAPAMEVECTLNGSRVAATLCDRMFHLDLGQMVVYFDGTTQWSYLPADKEVTIFTPTAAELAETNPLMILGRLDKDYSGAAVKGKPDTYRLTANSPRTQVNEVTVVINPKTGWPSRMTLIAGRQRIELANFKFTPLKTKKPAEAFKFKAPAGTSVNDLR